MAKPEEQARKHIDKALALAGWQVQDADAMNIDAARGVAVREFPLTKGFGTADYLLYVDGAAAGALEAKKAGTTLTGVEMQSEKYAAGLPDHLPAARRPLPFLYQSTGVETVFTNRLDPEPRSRSLFHFHRPETLAAELGRAPVGLPSIDGEPDPLSQQPASFRTRLLTLPALEEGILWPAQQKAVRNLELSFQENRPRALVQMATGSGKTFTAITSIYRLVKFADAKRVLFLVDRDNLGKQALKEFDQYTPADDHRTFTRLYNVQRLTSNKLDPLARVVITTIQRVYSMLRGETELASGAEETSIAALSETLKEPVPVGYNPAFPVEMFDVVFVDECHRSIYTLWRQVIEYFDAFLVGLTATPSKPPERPAPPPPRPQTRSPHPQALIPMATSSAQVVQKPWSYCHVLRDDGLSYGDYVEQLTYLLFLKMAHERTEAPWSQTSPIPREYAWPAKDGDALESHYRHTLEALGKQKGMLGIIFRKAQNKIQDPAKLRRLVADLIDREQWTLLESDVKGDAYEGLLEKNAQDTKGGAGQYFTPRPLIQAIVEVMRPGPKDTICDPACGTGGFLLAAHDRIVRTHPSLTREEKKHLKLSALHGAEIVDGVTRLCAMNLLLHGIGPNADEAPPPVETKDSLRGDSGERYSMILTNPPFGKKSSVMVVTDDGGEGREALTVTREDFWATTSNKQLNFVQHIKTILDAHGRAAVVVPDNVLFEGGAGETVRKKLLHDLDVHTLLRLPTGIFYAQGVKANVLFFDKKPASATPWTKQLWIYDLRTNKHFTLKTSTLARADLDDFVACYRAENRHARTPTWSPGQPEGRFRAYTYEEPVARDKCSLDIFWLKDESLEASENLPAPEIIARDIVEDIRAALEQFESVALDLGDNSV